MAEPRKKNINRGVMGTLNVLIADENGDHRKAIERILDSMGAGYISVSGPSEAVRQLFVEDEHFDCAILDVDMGGMGGLEAGRLIRRRSGDLPIIMLGRGGDRLETEIDARTIGGITLYINKPFTEKDFLNLLGRAIWLSRNSSEED